MIPKTIHYCWFGRGPKSDIAQKCMNSWKKYCPDYTLIEWNEENFDVNACPLYVRQAYECRKWAFVSDYVRLKVVYDYGGIYLDLDVELIKPLDSLLANSAYFGREDSYHVATGLGFGAEKSSIILRMLMDDYDNIPFVLEDGSIDDTPCPVRNTKVFESLGFVVGNSVQTLDGGIVIYPSNWFCPIDYYTGKKSFTKETVSIHHYSASWQTPEQRKHHIKIARKNKAQLYKEMILKLPNRVMIGILGKERYNNFKKRIKG